MKPLLLNHRVSRNRRLRLFDTTVGRWVLWCAQSWALRAEELQLLKATRRSMLRRITGTKRGGTEDYVTWIKRATKQAEATADAAHVRGWSTTHFHMKWSWAGHVARRSAYALVLASYDVA